MHSPGDYILLSVDKYEIKVMKITCASIFQSLLMSFKLLFSLKFVQNN